MSGYNTLESDVIVSVEVYSCCSTHCLMHKLCLHLHAFIYALANMRDTRSKELHAIFYKYMLMWN